MVLHCCIRGCTGVMPFPCTAGLGILATAQEAAEEEFEIDLNDVEPTFLKGSSSK